MELYKTSHVQARETEFNIIKEYILAYASMAQNETFLQLSYWVAFLDIQNTILVFWVSW